MPSGKKVGSEDEAGRVSLETTLRGCVCDPARLLDLVENFTIFQEVPGGLIKLTAKNHPDPGVNNALTALADIRQREGKVGVFWHTQGSGKKRGDDFLRQKVLRKLPGNWTFVVVTDRQELDGQIYKHFACRWGGDRRPRETAVTCGSCSVSIFTATSLP